MAARHGAWALLGSLALCACGAPERPRSDLAPACADAPAAAAAPPAAAPPAASPSTTLVLDGTPAIPDALRARVSQYINTRSAELASLAPDGRSVHVITRFGETAQLHHVAMPMGARRQLTFTEEPIRAAEPVPGTDTVLLLSDVGGSEDNQIYALEPGGRIRLLTDGRSRHESWVLSDDGARIAFNGNARDGRAVDVYVADGLDLAHARRVTTEPGHWSPLAFSHDGRRLIVVHYVSINDSRLHVVDLETGAMARLGPEAPAASYRAALFSRDGARAYVTTDREGEHVELYEVELASGTWRALTRAIPWSVESIALSRDGRTLALVVNEDGWSALHLLDTRTRRLTRPSGIPRGLVRTLRFARDAGVLGFTLSGPGATGDTFTYELARRRLVRWTESEIGGLDPAGFVEPELVRYPSFDERLIPAFFYRPRGDGPFPVVVLIHGGPEAQARPWFSPLVQYLARESRIAVAVPNVRGSDGYGKAYLQLDDGVLREDSVRDVGALLDWLAMREDVDPRRVAVFGGSYGGYMVLASLLHFGERLRAGVDLVGISNFVTFLENTRAYRQDLRRAEYGDERDPEMRAFLTRISPLTRAAEIRSALFVAHGANDPRVPVSEAEQLVAAVRASGQEVWYMLARDEGHGFRRKENADRFLQLGVMFLEQHLAPRE
ncbi:MAG: S9 family peptidase [Sandaracinaceae bacterium]|nr:S9 family peptidase [Sandaracinaceae bacterium]